jgi:hypothetical protein
MYYMKKKNSQLIIEKINRTQIIIIFLIKHFLIIKYQEGRKKLIIYASTIYNNIKFHLSFSSNKLYLIFLKINVFLTKSISF